MDNSIKQTMEQSADIMATLSSKGQRNFIQAASDLNGPMLEEIALKANVRREMNEANKYRIKLEEVAQQGWTKVIICLFIGIPAGFLFQDFITKNVQGILKCFGGTAYLLTTLLLSYANLIELWLVQRSVKELKTNYPPSIRSRIYLNFDIKGEKAKDKYTLEGIQKVLLKRHNVEYFIESLEEELKEMALRDEISQEDQFYTMSVKEKT